MSITVAVSLAIVAFFLGFAVADRLNRRRIRQDQDGIRHAVSSLRALRNDLASEKGHA